MCGIVGVAGNLEHKDTDVFRELLHVDYIRGKAATGIGTVAPNREIEVFKRACDPTELMMFTRFGTLVTQSKKMLLGHNRAPTIGQNNKFNAHPFEFGKVMGVHNGTLERGCLKDLEYPNMFDTDSEQLYCHIERHGIADAIGKVSGAWSLVYYDGEDNTINFLRNDERPMFYAFTKDMKRMYWASELWMLQGILHRNGIDTDNKWWSTSPDVHYSWVLPTVGQVFGEVSRFPCKGKARTPVQSYVGGSRGYGYNEWDWIEEKRKREEREARAAQTRKEAEEARIKKAAEEEVVVPFSQEKLATPLLPAPSETSSNNSTSETQVGVGGLIKANVVAQKLPPNRLEAHNREAIRKLELGTWKPPYFDKNGLVLPRFQWNKAVQDGCVNCGHSPSWGEFCKFGPDINTSSGSKVFVCESCSLNPEIVQAAMSM